MAGRLFARGGVADRLMSAALGLWLGSSVAMAGPIEVYREGPRFCPHDRSPAGIVLTEGQAIDRARAMLPADFCGPTYFVSGCDVVPEYSLSSWRIYFHQYRLRDGTRDGGGLAHSYVVLDPVGNCYANIPGTEQGAPR